MSCLACTARAFFSSKLPDLLECIGMTVDTVAGHLGQVVGIACVIDDEILDILEIKTSKNP